MVGSLCFIGRDSGWIGFAARCAGRRLIFPRRCAGSHLLRGGSVLTRHADFPWQHDADLQPIPAVANQHHHSDTYRHLNVHGNCDFNGYFHPTETEVPTNTPTPPPPPPTRTPKPPEPVYPSDSVIIGNITGYPQSYNLSCESRSAVDWARYFGVNISETEFLNALPSSDDPNQGFVGNVNDYGGQIPPNSYGVHADPVAKLLRAYGVPATAVYSMSAEAIRREIDAGRPVIAWVIVGTRPGYPAIYRTEAGDDVLVAPNEHTVIVIGYDPTGVTILDGGTIYWRNWETFMASFSVLNYMAVTYSS